MTTGLLRVSASLLVVGIAFLAGNAEAQPMPPASSATSDVSRPDITQPAAPAPPARSAATPPASAPIEREPRVTATSASVKQDDDLPVLFPAASRVSLSGYGGVDVGYTRLAGENAALTCIGGALLIKRTFALGLTGCGVPTRISGESYGNVRHEASDRLQFAYGGATAGYHFFPNRIYNLSLSAMVGGGAAEVVNRGTTLNRDDEDDDQLKATDHVFVAESRLSGFINITRWARAGAFFGYRLAGGVDLRNLSSSDLSGPVAGGTVQFGWF